MKSTNSLNRRQFLQTGLAGSAALAAAVSLPATAPAALTRAPADPFHGLKMGMTTYTLRNFSLDDAIAKTKAAGVKYISLKDVHLPLKSTKAERQEALKKVQDAGLTMMGGGVIAIPNRESEIRDIFEYARDAGMPTIICSPAPAALDTVEKMARDFNIRIAIHNHGPTDKTYPSPLDVLKAVKDRDPLMGLCIDVGHTVRIMQDPVPIIKECASRLYDFHIKDVTAATPKGRPTEVGRGVIDIVAVLKTFLEIKYAYQVALEYESNADHPEAGMLESYAYMRGVLAAI